MAIDYELAAVVCIEDPLREEAVGRKVIMIGDWIEEYAGYFIKSFRLLLMNFHLKTCLSGAAFQNS